MSSFASTKDGKICPQITSMDGSISLNANEKILVCGAESDNKSWSEIPPQQSVLLLKNITSNLGYMNTRFEIDIDTFNQLQNMPNVKIIDVRELDEQPLPTGFDFIKIPLSIFKEQIALVENETVIVFCQSGKRSLQAAEWLFDTFGESKKIYSLKGGILNWINHPSTQ